MDRLCNEISQTDKHKISPKKINTGKGKNLLKEEKLQEPKSIHSHRIKRISDFLEEINKNNT